MRQEKQKGRKRRKEARRGGMKERRKEAGDFFRDNDMLYLADTKKGGSW